MTITAWSFLFLGATFVRTDVRAHARIHVCQVYNHLPSLLGVSADHPVAKAAVETFMSSHNVTVDQERGSVVFTHPKPAFDGSTMTLSPEELVAMLLGYAKATGEEFAADGGERGTISDCVLTVPSFYTQTQRQALLDAARIAKLKVCHGYNPCTCIVCM